MKKSKLIQPVTPVPIEVANRTLEILKDDHDQFFQLFHAFRKASNLAHLQNLQKLESQTR